MSEDPLRFDQPGVFDGRFCVPLGYLSIYRAVLTMAACNETISHGLLVSGANLYDTPTDQRLPDLGRNQKMMLSSCHFHIVFMPSSYALCQTRVSVLSYWVYGWRCMGGRIAPHQTMG